MGYLRFVIVLMITGFLLPIFQSDSLADPDIRLGPVRVYPGLSLREDYTDNVFLTETDEKDVWVTTITPGVIFQLPLRRHLIQAEYRLEHMAYSKYTYMDTTEHFLSGLIDLNFPGGLGIKLGHEYRNTSNPPMYPGDPRHGYRNNRPAATITYRFADRYEAELAYFYEYRDFKRAAEEEDNYRKNDIGLTLFYRIHPKTWALFEGGYYKMDNEDLPSRVSTDSDNYRVWLGARWEPGAKLTGTLKGGYIARRYDVREGGKDEDNFGFRCDLEYHATPRDRITLTGFREILETFITTRESRYFGSSYISTGLDLNFRHQFTYMISGSLMANYTNDNFKQKGALETSEDLNKKRMDHRYIAGASLNYQFRDWLSCNMGYRYLKNDSNYSFAKYNENRVTFTISSTLLGLKFK